MSKRLTIPESEIQSFSDQLSRLPRSGIQICAHIRPDGDSIGSQIALHKILEIMGIPSSLILPPEIPEHLLLYLKGVRVQEPNSSQELAIVDCSDTNRVFTYATELQNNPILLNIDHHKTNHLFAKHNFVYPQACSTTHLLCEFIKQLDLPIDDRTADALYLGIFTDTGQFKFSRTNEHVFETCAWLCQQGANPEQVANTIFNQNSLAHYKLQTGFIDTIELELEGQFALGVLKHESFAEHMASPFPANRDCAELLRTLKGVKISAYIESLPSGAYKCSFRSNDKSYPIDSISLKLGGGGHPQAAGATVEKPLDELKNILIQEVSELLESDA